MDTTSKEPSRMRRWAGKALGTFRRRPVTSLAVGAAVGALAGAELIAAGLAGAAAVLLIERRARGRRAEPGAPARA